MTTIIKELNFIIVELVMVGVTIEGEQQGVIANGLFD